MTSFGSERDDLLTACVHEYAHQAVAQHFGIPGCVKIVGNGRDIALERRFVGTFTRFAEGDAHQKRMIGLAGTVAEEVFGNPVIEAFQIADFLEHGAIELSISDAECTGDYDDADIEECLALVRCLWTTILDGAMLEADLQARLLSVLPNLGSVRSAA